MFVAAAVVCGLALLWSTTLSLSHTFPDLLAPSVGDVRLVNYTCSEGSVNGTVEIYYDDGVHGPHWGYVCGSSALKFTAEVVCRQLGYSDGNLNVYETQPQENEGQILRQTTTNRTVKVEGGSSCGDYPPKNYSNDPVWLSDIDCGENNNFTHILRCNHTVSYGDPHSCDYLVVSCNIRQPELRNGQVRLCAPAEFPDHTQSTSLGVAQIYFNKDWGGVNQNNAAVPLGSYEADSICRQLGYTNAVTRLTMTVGSVKTLNQPLDFGYCASLTNTKNAWFKTDDQDNTLKCERSQDCFGCCITHFPDSPCSNSECSFTRDVVVKCEFDPSITGDIKGGSAELCKYNHKQLSSQACSGPQDWKLLFEIAVGVVGLLALILFCALIGCCVYCVRQYRNRARAGDGDRRGQQRLLRQQDDEN